MPCKLCSHILHIQPSSKFSQTSFPSKPPNIKANGWNCSHHLTQLQLVENGGLTGRLGHGPSCRHRRQWGPVHLGKRSKMVKTPFCTFKNCFKNKNSFFRVIPTVVYMSEYVLTFYLADTLIFYLVPEDALSCILSDIWSGIFFDVLLDIFSGILSGI